MGRIRVTGRFYVFLAMLAIGMFFIAREFFASGPLEALITPGSTSYDMRMDAVVVRDESVASYEGNGRVVYLAEEGVEVQQGQDIADVYSAEYSIKVFENLEKTRKDIQAYHQTILREFVDNNLERLEGNVQAQALELKRLIKHKSSGSLLNIQKSLEQTMLERQNYLRSNRREDQKLNAYYEKETTQMNSLASWKSAMKADKNGVISFYLDGYESVLTPDSLDTLSADQIKTVLAGKPLATSTPNARLRQNVFKVVSTDKWYVVLYSADTSWNPVKDQVFQMQMENVNGFVFVGKVVSLQKGSGDVLALVEVDTPLGPMLGRRSGKVDIGVNLTGFTVPVNAITTQNGQAGVLLSGIEGGTFVPVEVLKTDSRYALVEPIVEGTLPIGERVLLH